MATVPAPTNAAVGNKITASGYNTLVTAANFLLTPPGLCLLRNATVQSIPNITWTSCLFDTEDLDPDGMHVAGSTSKVTPQTPGWYQVTAHCAFAANSTGYRLIAVIVNGTTRYRGMNVPAASSTVEINISVSKAVYLNGTTDYVEAQVFQSSGGALNTFVTENACTMQVERLSA